MKELWRYTEEENQFLKTLSEETNPTQTAKD